MQGRRAQNATAKLQRQNWRTENARQKQAWKIKGLKLWDQSAGVENARLENAGGRIAELRDILDQKKTKVENEGLENVGPKFLFSQV